MRFLRFCVIFTTILVALNAEGGDIILGKWWSGDPTDPKLGKSHVLIQKENGKYFGEIIWLRFPKDENGNDKTDKHNPDEKLRKKPLKGLQLMYDFVYDPKQSRWVDGKIYNPDEGKTYSCYMEILEDGTLKVRGFIGVSLLGKTRIWFPVEENNLGNGEETTKETSD